MSETDKYSIKRSTSYDRRLITLLKKHYKRNQKALEDFRGLLDTLEARLVHEPLAIGDQEPWPRGTYQEGWDLRKVRFKMPGLHGQAREGRYVYLVDLEARLVKPVIPYTHKQYPHRPDLKSMIEGEMS